MREIETEKFIRYIQEDFLVDIFKGKGFKSAEKRINCYYFIFQLEPAINIDILFDMIKKNKNIKEVYLTKLTELDVKGKQFCFYSTFGINYPIKINAIGSEKFENKCIELFITLYNSLEELEIELESELEIQKYIGRVIKSIKKEELLMDFIRVN